MQVRLVWANVYDGARLVPSVPCLCGCVTHEAHLNLPICARYIASPRGEQQRDQQEGQSGGDQDGIASGEDHDTTLRVANQANQAAASCVRLIRLSFW